MLHHVSSSADRYEAYYALKRIEETFAKIAEHLKRHREHRKRSLASLLCDCQLRDLQGRQRHWQFNYSGIGGSLASGAISNLYYPSTDRSAAALTFENTLIGIGETAAANIFQEFVFKRLTSHVPSSSNLNTNIP